MKEYTVISRDVTITAKMADFISEVNSAMERGWEPLQGGFACDAGVALQAMVRDLEPGFKRHQEELEKIQNG